MKTERVFTGLDTKENVILVYKKDDNVYLDLLNKNQVFPLENINISSLKRIGEVIDMVKYSSPANIRRRFEKDKSIISNKTK